MTTQDPSTSIKAEPAARETVRGPQTSLDGPLMHDFEMFLHSLFGADADGLCMHLRRQEDGALLVNSLPSTSVGMEKWTHAAVLALAAEGRLTGAFFEGLLARIPRRASEILALQRRILGEASIVTEPTRSHALVFQGQFLQQPTIISPNEVLAALHPVLPYGEPESISLKAIDLRDPEAWNAAQAPLREQLTRFLEKKVRPTTHPHVSVFGLGPTPWLVALGNYLGDTLPTSLHGRLRSPPTWSWQAERWSGTALHVEKSLPERRSSNVALLLSISARLAVKDVDVVLPRRGRAICEISIEQPRVDAVRTKSQLGEIAGCLRDVLGEILERTGRSSPIHLFAAAPAPVLLALGQNLPRRVAPAIFVHDYDNKHGFGPALPLITQ
jgi:hypothetical protein